MKEFGSDFHIIKRFNDVLKNNSKATLYDFYSNFRVYASGRHAIEAIFKFKKWKRLWVPAYFCYEVIRYLQLNEIEVLLYDDNPLKEGDDNIVRSLPYKTGDVLLRMNYFGHRTFRSNMGISVPVIEDHTQDVISSWARESDADYCIASVRKTMPIAAGGILWSPQSLEMPDSIVVTDECKKMVAERYDGMLLKHDYLKGAHMDKVLFREKYLKTEEIIDKLPISGVDSKTLSILKSMNYALWDEKKKENWKLANDILKPHFNILQLTEPFSIIILCNTEKERTALRRHLINNMIYPAILWNMPEDSKFKDALYFSKRMISVHCDARYSRNEIKEMCNRILSCCI